MLSHFSCVQLCNPMDCSPPGTSVHGDSPGKNTGVGCHARLQGIVLIQGSNLDLLRLLHRGRLLYCSAIGKPCILKCPYPIPSPCLHVVLKCSVLSIYQRPELPQECLLLASQLLISGLVFIPIRSSLFFSLNIIYLAVPGLSCGMWHLVPQPGIRPGPPHWEYGVLGSDHQGRTAIRSRYRIVVSAVIDGETEAKRDWSLPASHPVSKL